MKALCSGFISIFFIALPSALASTDPVAGRWEGLVQIPDAELTLIIDFAAGNNGTWSGSVTIPGFDIKGKALSNLVVKGSQVSFEIATARGLEATLKGNVAPDGIFTGDFSEAGNTARFVLKKIGPPQVESPSRNTAISKVLEGEWTGQFEIYGTPIKVSIKLTSHGSEAGDADFVITGRKTDTLPVDLVSQQDNFVMVESHEAGISYEGTFNPDSGEIKGTYTHATIEFPLLLRRQK